MEQDKSDRISELFNQARNEKPKVSFKETQQQFVQSVSGSASFAGSSTFTKIFTVKSIIISLVTISVLAIGGTLLFTDDNTLEKNPVIITEDKIIEEQNTAIANLQDVEETTVEVVDYHTEKSRKEVLVNPNLSPQKEELPQKPIIIPKKVLKSKNKKTDTSSVFPVLTAKEIKANNKQKMIMLKYLARYKRMPAHNNIDDRKYPMIYWNEVVKDGKIMAINATDAFYMQNTEVSVLEYRTFLFDLLIQGRKEDFLIAKPDQEQWVKAFEFQFNQPMVDNYFSHPAYNDYPINNISRKGAEMYCEWLTAERNKLNPEKYGYLANAVRLPTAKEWVQAASNRGKNPIYPWGNNEKGCDSCYFANYQPIKGNFIADGGFHTVKVNSYNANAGMYCMSGNVAEMVTYEDGTVGALGGSWTSLPDEIKINAPDKYKGVSTPNVNIGFRPVILYLSTSKNESDTSNRCFTFPVLTYKEIQENNDRKKKMSSMNSKLEAFGFLSINKGEVSLLKGQIIKADDFQIKQTEVTNLQYRTFLLDLLINNRKDDFLLAKPDQTQWDNSFVLGKEVMKMNYFSHPIYNDYPVVNISRKGAEMYCEWLAEEINIEQFKKLNGMKIQVSLPNENQWIYAASGGKKNSYSWGGMETRQNDRGCFMANYKYSPKIDTVSITGCDVNYPNALTTSGILLGENNYLVKVNSYNPNDFKLYCMSGNVAEMVVYDDGTIGTKGGSWTSIGKELQILNKNERFKGIDIPNVNIGFRPVMTFMGHGKYKTTFTPPGTVKVDKSTYMDKTEISNFMWLEYLSWQEKNYGKEAEEYKNALPDTTVWNIKGKSSPYQKHYLRHAAYSNYPVVGISYQQAVAYCNWRTARVKELYVIKRKEDKKTFYSLDFEYRLPTKEEWEAVAAVGYSEKVTKKMKNMAQSNLAHNLNDTIKKYDVNSADVTAPVQSYYPNKLGCYNLVGNVAEMTAKKGVAKGGSYLQTEKEVRVEKDFEYSKPEKWLGFRCIVEVIE